jgi:hypothetical protein
LRGWVNVIFPGQILRVLIREANGWHLVDCDASVPAYDSAGWRRRTHLASRNRCAASEQLAIEDDAAAAMTRLP